MTLASPASAAAAPTFDKVPVAEGYDDTNPVTLSGTAEAGDTVTLYEAATSYGAGYSVAVLAQNPANDYSRAQTGPGQWPPLTVKADSRGRWTIQRPMDSGHVLMVGTDDGYSNRRYAAVRVQPIFTATATGNNEVSLSVGVNPGQPGLTVKVERYTSSGWTEVAAGQATAGGADGGSTGFSATVTGQPGGTPTYRALVGNTSTGWADTSTYVITNYSTNVRLTVAGTAGATPAPSGSNPRFEPAYAEPDGGPITTSPSASPAPSSSPSPNPGTTPKPTTPAPALGAVQFTRIQYNAPGVDRKTNKSIKGEHFRLTNKTKKSLNVKGWTVRDAAGNLYRFTTNYTLAAGKSVTVSTGKGSNTTATRYWGKTNHVWNNSGDSALLRTDKNKTIDTCKWTRPGKGYTTC